MKWKSKTLIIVSFIMLFISCNKSVNEKEARVAIEKHMQERYGKSFSTGFIGYRGVSGRTWFQTDIYPNDKEEYDSYYEKPAGVEVKKGILGEKLDRTWDQYWMVEVNELANEFYGKKIKELFGDQYLMVMEIDYNKYGRYNTFEDVIKSSRDSSNPDLIIGGGIYLFGRIDTLEEKEIYREKIFEFIEYMKETGSFEYTDLAFYILDERCLTERFDKEIGDKLVKAREEIKTADEFITYRKELLNELDGDYKNMISDDKMIKINHFNRRYLREFYKNDKNKYSVIRHAAIISPKYWEVKTLLQFMKKLYYDSKEEIILYNSIKINYREYDDKKFDMNEWEG